MQVLVPYFVGTSETTVETSCGSGGERCAAGKASAAAVAAGRYGCTSVCSGSMPLVEASKLPAPTRDKTFTKTFEEATKVPATTGVGEVPKLPCGALQQLNSATLNARYRKPESLFALQRKRYELQRRSLVSQPIVSAAFLRASALERKAPEPARPGRGRRGISGGGHVT